MKKYLYTLLVSLALFGCQDKELTQLDNSNNYVAPTFVTVPDDKLYEFHEDQKDDIFSTVEWTAANYGNDVQAEYKYNIVAEVEGYDNAAIVTSVTGSITSVDIKVVDMNSAVNKITGITNAGGVKEESVNIRVEAFIGDHSDNATNTSTKNTHFVVKPYFVIEAPENLFVIGDGIGGWTWGENDIQMIPVHSHPEKFWAVLYLEAGKGIKFSPVQDWKGDFGSDGSGEGELGIRNFGGDNITTPKETGYYMVVVDYGLEQILIIEPQVYLIGNTVGSWDAHNPDAILTADNPNKVMTITRELAADELRMYAAAVHNERNWLGDWWQSEFIILNGEIVYRGTGDDQERVKVSGGTTTINLDFQSSKGEIK